MPTSEQKLDSLAGCSHSYRDVMTAKKRESAQYYQRDKNKSQQPGSVNIIATNEQGLHETEGTRVQRLFTGFLFNSYLFCLFIYPYLDLMLQ